MSRLLVLLFALLVSAGSAAAQEPPRVALVIGNGQYETVPSLTNPSSDAQLIGSTLQNLGFAVSTVLDADQTRMQRAIRDFGAALREAGPQAVGLFYYAGHGVQANGINYLIPVDAVLENEADLTLSAVAVDGLLEQMNSAGNAMNIIVLDACRNNPFATATRAVSRGLATIDAPSGTYIAFATAPGDVALDGRGDNSPFTMALAEAMLMPGMPIEQMFKQVRRDVREETAGQQTPWDSSSLLGDFSFVVAEEEEEHAAEAALWAEVKGTQEPAVYEVFLRVYPKSMFAGMARAKIAELNAEAVANPRPQTAEPRAEQFAFGMPLYIGDPAIDGWALEELVVDGMPAFSPIEGLEASIWQQPCAACHNWTRTEFCSEAGRLSQLPDRDGRLHPFGDSFREHMVGWAAAGCE